MNLTDDMALLALQYMMGEDELSDDLALLWLEYIDTAFARLPFHTSPIPNDSPYKDWQTMADHINTYGLLYVSNLHCEHPYLSPVMNIKARSIHDYVHVKHKLGFSYEDEYKVFQHEAHALPDRYKPLIPVLFSETVLQAACFTFYGVFPPQKVVMVQPSLINLLQV